MEQKYLLRKTFAIVERQSDIAALIFYKNLFELDPSLRHLFKSDIEEQAKKLMEMLSAALALLDSPGQLASVLEGLGARHVAYGVETHHYDTVGLALMAMVENILGDDFTPDIRSAWSDLYKTIASAMIHGAALAAKQQLSK